MWRRSFYPDRRRLGDGLLRYDFHGSYEAIANPRHSFDVLGRLRCVAQRLTKLIDRCRQILVEIDKDIIRPEGVAELFAKQGLAGSLDQQSKNGQRLALDFESRSKLPQFAMTEVGFVGTEANGLLLFFGDLAT